MRKGARHYRLGSVVTIFVNAVYAQKPVDEDFFRLSDLEHILARSCATETFKNAVRRYVTDGGADHIRVEGFAPHIKVRRLLTHILSVEPHLAIERVTLHGRSGCSDFVGRVHVDTTHGARIYDFAWDCRWRAEQEGWTDCFGLPDQIRAAEEYDWRCFERWELSLS